MPISAQQINSTVAAYLAAYPDDAAAIAPLTAALGFGTDLTSRKEFGGHVTASAVLIGPDGRVLLVHHRALDRWLCPGGHLEPGDTDVSAAAVRELTEETGVSADDFEPVRSTPLHIDVHPIPANDAKDEPDHQHFDFRMAFRMTGNGALSLQEEEVLGAAWRPVTEIADTALRTRVAYLVGTFDASGAVSAR
jgi:8-oxo-dGTP pyrophosphatase MutT (NUDIX family)